MTLLLALGALLLFYEFFLPKPPSDFIKPSLPLSTDEGADGEQAIWRWLTAQGIPVTSLRQRYAQLQREASGGVGNVLITVMPHRTLIRNDEWAPLMSWIGAGNTALVLAALDDTPNWSLESTAGLGGDSAFLAELPRLTQLGFTPVPPEKEKDKDKEKTRGSQLTRLLAKTDVTLEPRGLHPLMSQVHSVHASSEIPSSRWRAAPAESHLPLALMQRSDSREPALWVLAYGKGQVIVLSVASPFSNREIDHADNARLLANIIGWSRAPGGRVVFDDAHQGLSTEYDSHAFFADPRLHRTAWWIVLLWLAFVLGPLPLRSAFSPWRPVDETALLDASGRFYSNAVTRADAARRLFENFFNGLRRRLSLTENGEPLWDWLGAQAAVPTAQRALLQGLYARLCAEQRVDLTQLQNLLTDLQGKLA